MNDVAVGRGEASVPTGIHSGDMLVGQHRLNMHIAGPADAPVALLLHDGAFGTDALLCWEGVFDELSARFRVVAPDLLGWGGSDKAIYFDRPIYDVHLGLLGGVLDILASGKPVYVIGASFGGSLALEAVARSAFPGVRTVVSIGGSMGLYRRERAFDDLRTFSPTLDDARKITSYLVGFTEGMEEHVERRLENSRVPGHIECLTARRLVLSRGAPEVDSVALLRQSNVKKVVVSGSEDRLLERGWAEALAERIGGQALVVSGGHEPHLVDPVQVVRALDQFLQ